MIDTSQQTKRWNLTVDTPFSASIPIVSINMTSSVAPPIHTSLPILTDGTPCFASNPTPSTPRVETWLNDRDVDKDDQVLLEASCGEDDNNETLFFKHLGEEFNDFVPNNLDEFFQQLCKWVQSPHQSFQFVVDVNITPFA